ncbi:MAG: serine hydrolase [Proteobacteria bacterium]|nr:serine hydrolase [Pseudomonadota bacterium]
MIVADGFAPVAQQFAAQLGSEIGAAVTIHHRGRCVVDLWGGHTDAARTTPWTHDTRIVVFSVTKGLAAMALALLADRGQLAWDAPDTPLTLDEMLTGDRLVRALETQRPAWQPGEAQGYHAITYGMYVRELFERIAHESMGSFLRRELFEPLGADVALGTTDDARIATLYPPSTATRVGHLLHRVWNVHSPESRILRGALRQGKASLARQAFGPLKIGLADYNSPRVRRLELPWASAVASAHGLSRAYLPFASGGAHDGRAYLRTASVTPLYERESWAARDGVLAKPLGWTHGFLKEETTTFSPNRESFGHAGMGGALGWCDPVAELTFGYVMNRLDWRVRSPRAIALCRALYACEPVRAMTATTKPS